VSLFRRREPLHERLAREGGLGGAPASIDTRPPWQETGVHGLHRPRDWDVTVAVNAPEIDGDAVRFVVLPDRTLLVEEGPEASLEPLAAAVEQSLQPPYRARAARQSESLWAVQARRIEVVEVTNGPEGDSIELTRTSDGTTLSVDDARAFGSIPKLERRGEREGAEYVVRADRLDGDLWEVTAAPL
jgi:hypothetical protein